MIGSVTSLIARAARFEQRIGRPAEGITSQLLEALGATIVAAATLAFAVTYSLMAAQRYALFRAGVDTGIFLQILSSAFSGFHSTVEGNLNHLAVHFSPVLYLIAPLVIVTRNPLVPSIVQAIAGALVIPALYLIARRRMNALVAAASAGIAAFYAPLAGVVFADFHEESLVPAVVLWLFNALDAGACRVAVVLAMLALGIKEDVAPSLFFAAALGVAYYRRRRDRSRANACEVIAVLAVTTFLAYFFVVRPIVDDGGAYWSFHFYSYSYAPPNGSPAGFMAPLDGRRWTYIVQIMRPLLWLPILSPAFVLALPGLAEVLASHEAITLNLGTHYAGTWIGFVLLAFVFTVAALDRRSHIVALTLVLLAIGSARHDLVDGDPIARWYYLSRPIDGRDVAVAGMIAHLPPDAAVGAPDRIFAHLGLDRNAGISLDRPLVLIDERETDMSETWNANKTELLREAHTGRFRLVQDVDGVQLYRRTEPGPP